MTRPEGLSEDGARIFDALVSLGMSESSAAESLRRDGWLPADDQSGFDAATATFRNVFGMSEGAARTAAIGRMSVSEARAFWDSGSSVVSESAAVATRSTSLQLVTEAAAIGKSSDSKRFRARIIASDVFGASGFYSSAVLQEAAADRVFGASLGVYLDHPTETEQAERPNRSVRDLAGRLASDAVFESDGLHADIEFYPHVASVVAAMKDDVGLSIRAMAEAYQGKVAGRSGTIISRITEALSVDVVTRAGAGGRLLSLVESAKRQR